MDWTDSKPKQDEFGLFLNHVGPWQWRLWTSISIDTVSGGSRMNFYSGQNEQNTSNKTRGIIKTRGKDPALDIVIVLS